ncbi:MAG TPA: hypothetical protein ENN77_01310, partial [Candidatus Wirthbacteria bacterium]|nr:hypothetical protein [Candidatus Wirthbacteria bacterium]
MSKKLHTIYLESNSEITDVIDQIRLSVEDIVALVAADRISLLQSLVNIKLILKNSQAKSKQILLITQDPIARQLAEQSGMRNFGKLQEAEVFLGLAESVPGTALGQEKLTRVKDLEQDKADSTIEIKQSQSKQPAAQSSKSDFPKQNSGLNDFLGGGRRTAALVLLFLAILPVALIAYVANTL